MQVSNSVPLWTFQNITLASSDATAWSEADIGLTLPAGGTSSQLIETMLTKTGIIASCHDIQSESDELTQSIRRSNRYGNECRRQTWQIAVPLPWMRATKRLQWISPICAVGSTVTTYHNGLMYAEVHETGQMPKAPILGRGAFSSQTLND